MSSNVNPKFDEIRWVIEIRKTLDDDDLEDELGIPVSIFNVPKTLLASKPEVYRPQEVAIGPYHHWHAELYEMERYKLSAARRMQKQLPDHRFEKVVSIFNEHEVRIRAHYHHYLDLNGETLAWMMAVDASFLLEFIQVVSLREAMIRTEGSSRMSHLVDFAGKKSIHNAILRDVLMLENQIPLCVLKIMSDIQFASEKESQENLSMILMSFLKEVCPLKMIESFPIMEFMDHASHLLDLVYHVLVPQSVQQFEINIAQHQTKTPAEAAGEPQVNLNPVLRLLRAARRMAPSLNVAPIQYVRKAALSKPVKFVVKLRWKLITKFPLLSALKKPVDYVFSLNKDDGKSVEGGLTRNSSNRPPSVEEIAIPSVTELVGVGVKFTSTNGSLSTVKFDQKKVTFYLPAITLDLNTEAILRNLVAFEASFSSGSLVFTRYTQLMNGIIDTEEDVMLLRKAGVVFNCMKSDAEAANLWNGMCNSVRLTKEPFLDAAIGDVNKYYNSRPKVKIAKFMKSYVLGSWQFLAFLACILLLLLTTLEAFCSVYTCSLWFKKVGEVSYSTKIFS